MVWRLAVPERIQLSRARGWRKPPGAVVVARPSRWGNPFTLSGAIESGYARDVRHARTVVVAAFRAWLLGEGRDSDVYVVGERSYDRRWMREHLAEIRGRDLACWCPAGQQCHADVLLALSNQLG